MQRRRGCRRAVSEGNVRPRRISRFLEPALLLLLHQHPAHGYALVEGLSSLGLESYPADISAIYRLLYGLEELEMITSVTDAEPSAGPPRRVYTLTDKGECYLASWVKEIRATDRLLHNFLEAYEEHLRQESEQV